MSFDPDVHRRRSMRLRGYDYTRPGFYFVTICAFERQMVFEYPAVRRIVDEQWGALARRFQGVGLDAFVIMPDHVHGILEIRDRDQEVDGHVPAIMANVGEGRTVVPGSLPAIVGAFKAAVARRTNRLADMNVGPIWQRGYWERVIRDDVELEATRGYIAENPIRWQEKRDNLDALLARMSAMDNG